MAKRKRRKALYAFLLPMLLCAAAFAAVADNTLAAGGMGLLVGFFIGLGIMAFPNLDRGGPADSDDTMIF